MRAWRVWGLLGASGAVLCNALVIPERGLWHGRETIDWWREPQGRCFSSRPHKLLSEHPDDFVIAVSIKENRELKPRQQFYSTFFVFPKPFSSNTGVRTHSMEVSFATVSFWLHPSSPMYWSSLKYFMDQREKLRTLNAFIRVFPRGAFSSSMLPL